MNKKRLVLSSVVALGLLVTTVIAQQVGESVFTDQPLFSNQYLAGRIVQVTAPNAGKSSLRIYDASAPG